MSIVVNDQTSQRNPKNQKCQSNAKYIITIAIIVPIIFLFVLRSFYIYCSGAQLFQWKINKNPRPSGRGTSHWIGLESLFRIWHIIFRKSFLYSIDFVEERLEADNKTLKILQYLIR